MDATLKGSETTRLKEISETNNPSGQPGRILV
jgi:hypothetical protein